MEQIAWGTFLTGLFFGGCAGIVGLSLVSINRANMADEKKKMDGTLDDCDACKKLMCENCPYFAKLNNARAELKGVNEALAKERRSNRALGGVVNSQLYHIKELKAELRLYKRTERKIAFNDMVRGL